MTEGRSHRRDNDSKAALQSFQAADSIMHVPTTGLEVAKTEIQLGQLLEARDKLLSVTRLPIDENEPRAFSEARATAKTLGAEIEAKIPSIAIKIPGVTLDATVKVTVDGVEVPPAALTAPRPVDPGHHVVVAHLGTGEAREAQVDVREGETKDVSLEVPSAAPTDTEAVTPEPSAESSTSPNRVGQWRLASYIGFGVGGAGLIMGSITGLVAISDFNSAKKQGCIGNQCPPSTYPGLDKAGTMATVSTVGFILAGVGVGAGVFGFVMARRAAAPPSTSSAGGSQWKETPSLGFYVGPLPGGGSASLQGRF
jgi:hypothetical protein